MIFIHLISKNYAIRLTVGQARVFLRWLTLAVRWESLQWKSLNKFVQRRKRNANIYLEARPDGIEARFFTHVFADAI